MLSRRVFAGLFVGLLATPFLSPAEAAEAAAPVPVYGTIQKVEGDAITVKNQDGSSVTFNLAPMGRVVSNQKLDVKDITTNHLIAVDTAMKDGKQVVTQLHTQFFTRGAAAAPHRPLASDKNVTRHLGKVSAVTPTANGVMLKVTEERNLGEVTLEASNAIPLLYHNKDETRAALKPGMMVMANAAKGADGKLSAGFVTVEANGAKPVRIPE